MQLFLDTEFTSLDRHAQLISIGMCAEDGALFYAEVEGIAPEACTPFVREVVLPLLSGHLLPRFDEAEKNSALILGRGNVIQVRQALQQWLLERDHHDGKHVVWADVLAWDWILFCDLFGNAFGIPKQIHYIPMDLATWLYAKGIDPDTDRTSLATIDCQIPPLRLERHHALYDAFLEQAIYHQLKGAQD
jgi:hypothetical protein